MQSVANSADKAMLVYDKTIHDQLFKKNVLWMNIRKNVTFKNGPTKRYFNAHYGRNVGSAAGSETVTLPNAGYQKGIQGNITMKKNYHTIELTDFALEASKNSEEYLVNLLEDEYNGAKNDMQRQLSRQGYGVGTGVICQVNDASPDTTLTFDNPMTGKYPTENLFDGNALMFSDDATSASSAAYTTISSVTGDNTMTVASATGIADDDYVYLAHTVASGSPDTSNVNAEVMGLKGLIDDASNVTTLHGLSRSTYIWFKSYVDSSSSQRSLTDPLMHSTLLKAKQKGKIKYGIAGSDVVSAYGQVLSPDRRYTANMKLEGGFTGVAFSDVPIVDDYDAPYDELYWIDPSTLSVEQMAPVGFLKEDGNILSRHATQPAWKAVLRYYAQLANTAPNKSSALRDVIQ